MSKKRIVYYLNQFFGQIGGEDKADIEAQVQAKPIGPAVGLQAALADEAEIVATVICGDNYFNENKDAALAFLGTVYEEYKPDIVVAGPAFNAGRYGMACAGVAEYFAKLDVPVISGMYEENPGLDIAKKVAYVVKTGNSAADMRHALPLIAGLVKKIANGERPHPETDEYFEQGIRLTVITDKSGSQRGIEMLMKRLKGEEFETEMPMPVFDQVEPAPGIKDMSKAVIALVTSGGIVPIGNPDHIQSASAQKWGKYNVEGMDDLSIGYCTIHGGYDPVYANESPDRVVPLDALRKLEKEGKIGHVYDYFYTTTGTGTAVGNSITFGREIGAELKEAGVDGVILTST